MCDIASDCTSLFLSFSSLFSSGRHVPYPRKSQATYLPCDTLLCGTGRTLFILAFFSPDKEKTYPAHQSGDRDRFLSALGTHLKTNELSKRGPFVIGKSVTYADLVIYQICHDENLTQDGRKGLKDYPRLKQLVDAVEGRENVRAFLKSERYLG